MANLVSSTISVGTTISNVPVTYAQELIPLDGDLYIWYGAFTGTAEELLAQGAPIPEGGWLKHIRNHDGNISMVAASGTVTVHIVG